MYPQHEWMNRAACRGATTSIFFPETIGVTTDRIYDEARSFCAQCDVRYECLKMALTMETPDVRRYGVWGGMSPEERDDL